MDSQDNRKVSCLMAAFRRGHIKVVKWMVKKVSQFPSEQEIKRYITTVTDKVRLLVLLLRYTVEPVLVTENLGVIYVHFRKKDRSSGTMPSRKTLQSQTFTSQNPQLSVKLNILTTLINS